MALEYLYILHLLKTLNYLAISNLRFFNAHVPSFIKIMHFRATILILFHLRGIHDRYL